MGYGYFGWQPYVSVADKRANAQRELAKLRKQRKTIAPVSIEGRKIANSFWGKSWCENLERYSDFAYRLPRGRSYLRNGAVLDLQVTKGKVTAIVVGSELYKIKVNIAPLSAARWKAICKDCAGSVDSMIELLQGRFEKSVMNRVSREGDGLFPAPDEIKLSCNCPDWADMCKHVAAALYGIGARLDDNPQLLFLLRGVDEADLLAGASIGLPVQARPATAAVLDDTDVAALFGLEIAGTAPPTVPPIRLLAKNKKAAATTTQNRTKLGAAAKKQKGRSPTSKAGLRPLL